MLVDLVIGKLICPFSDTTLTLEKKLSIKGQIKQKDIPYVCRVRLYEKNSGRLALETLTDNEGFYEFNYLSNNTYYIIAQDPERKYNAIIQDNVIPK